jgi:hypothetical protein
MLWVTAKMVAPDGCCHGDSLLVYADNVINQMNEILRFAWEPRFSK